MDLESGLDSPMALNFFAGSFMVNVGAGAILSSMVSVDGFIGTPFLLLDDVNFCEESVGNPIL